MSSTSIYAQLQHCIDISSVGDQILGKLSISLQFSLEEGSGEQLNFWGKSELRAGLI